MSEQQHQDSTEVSGATTPRSPRLRSDDIVGAVILLFCAATYAITTTFEEVPAMLSQGIQPAVFPRMMIIVIAFLTVIMMVQGHRKARSERRPVPMVAFVTAGLLVVFVAAIDWLGMIVASFLFCIVLPLLWGERRFGWIIVFAVLFPASIFVLFSKLLEVRFPSGVFHLFGA